MVRVINYRFQVVNEYNFLYYKLQNYKLQVTFYKLQVKLNWTGLLLDDPVLSHVAARAAALHHRADQADHGEEDWTPKNRKKL